MITLTTAEQTLVRFKVDSRVKEADLPISILTALAEEAENDLKLRLSTTYGSLNAVAQALYRSAVVNLTAALAVASVRLQTQQRAGPVAKQWQSESLEAREKNLRDLYESKVSDLVDLGHGSETGSGSGIAFAALY